MTETTLPRQTCRGHLERGSSYTVGTLPSGETRPYWTEVLEDGRRFHYCPECVARLWITAEAEKEELLRRPMAEREGYDAARARSEAYFRAFRELDPIREGERIFDASNPKKGRPVARVLRVNSTTVTARYAYDLAEGYVPLEHVVRDWSTLLEHAHELAVDDEVELEELPLVVIPCGSKKLEHAAPAAELYVGSYFEAMLRAARALVPDARIRVLSGRYGFVELDRVLSPYEQRIDGPGGLTVEELAEQVHDEVELSTARRVVILAGKAYAERAADALALGRRFREPALEVEIPFEGARGIGDHLARAKRIAELCSVCGEPAELRYDAAIAEVRELGLRCFEHRAPSGWHGDRIRLGFSPCSNDENHVHREPTNYHLSPSFPIPAPDGLVGLAVFSGSARLEARVELADVEATALELARGLRWPPSSWKESRLEPGLPFELERVELPAGAVTVGSSGAMIASGLAPEDLARELALVAARSFHPGTAVLEEV